ncbi:hypothetical protein [Microbispora sp. H10949]|uniref:hypothetical protein n=1 Tax=Microbispora sp. H10949 TaxID=2729111 RepID=UPI0016020480|nr:hypothetical protein [Microbispora sp. H10949]
MAFYRSRRLVLDDQAALAGDGLARFTELARQYGASERAKSRAFAIVITPCMAIVLAVPFVVGIRVFDLGFIGSFSCLYIAAVIPGAVEFAGLVRTFKHLAMYLISLIFVTFIGLMLLAIGLALSGGVVSIASRPFPWMEAGITSASYYISMLLVVLVGVPLQLMAEILINRRWPEAIALRQILWALETMSATPHRGPDERKYLSQIFGRISHLIRLHLPAVLPSSRRAGHDMLRSRCRLAAQAVREYELDAILATGATRAVLQENLRKLALVIIYADYGDLPLPKNEPHVTTRGVLNFLVRTLRLVCVGLLVPAAVWAAGRMPMPAWWDAYRDGATVVAVAWVVTTLFVLLNPHYKDPLEVAKEFLSMFSSNRRQE